MGHSKNEVMEKTMKVAIVTMMPVDDLCEDDSALFSSHISHIRRKLQAVLNPVDVERFCIKRHAGGIYRIGALKR